MEAWLQHMKGKMTLGIRRNIVRIPGQKELFLVNSRITHNTQQPREKLAGLLAHPHPTVLIQPLFSFCCREEIPFSTLVLVHKDTASGDKGEVPHALTMSSLSLVWWVHSWQALSLLSLEWLNASLVGALFVTQCKLDMSCLGLFRRIMNTTPFAVYTLPFIDSLYRNLFGTSDGRFSTLETLGK